MSRKLYPDNWIDVDETPADRTPKPAHKQRAKQVVKALVDAGPKTYDALLAAIEADQPCVFTTPEAVELLDDLHAKWLAKRAPKQDTLPGGV